MTTPTSNLGLLKGVGSDNWRTYLKTSLASSLDVLDKGVSARVFDARGYGASPSASASANCTAIRAAITAASSAGGGVVTITGGPSAVFQIGASGATYSLTLASNVSLVGDGAVLQRGSGNTEQLVGAGSALTDVRIEGLTLDNQDAVVFSGGLVAIPNGSSRITLNRCRFTRLAYAIAVQVATGTVQSTDIRMVDCTVDRTLANVACTGSGPATCVENVATVGIYDASIVWVERCRFDNVGALHFEALNATACPTTAPMSHIYLLDCVFTRIKTTCVFATPGASCAMAQVVIEGNTFLNVGKEMEKGALALSVAGTTDGVIVRGNTIKDWGYTGSTTIGADGNAAQAIATSGSGAVLRGLVIEGNDIDARDLSGTDPAAGSYGISVGQSAVDVVITGNRITRTGYAGIRIQGVSTATVDRWVIADNTIVGCALHNDSALKEGGIVITDYATAGTIANNLCLDNGSGGGASGQDAGIALRTGTSATTIADVKIHGNHCYDTRAGGSKKQLWGIRVGDTGSSDSAQPTRITVQGNDVGVPNVNGGNATSGLYFQRTADLGYVVSDNAGFSEGIGSGTGLVASANDLVLPMMQRQGGRHFFYKISGTTQINRINRTNFKPGDIVILHFAGSLTVTHGGAANADPLINIQLAGSANFSATSFDKLSLIYDDDTPAWAEVGRTVI